MMPWLPDAVEAALIAGGVTVVGLLITNQAKVSEFRQQWINALRDDVASFLTHSIELHALTSEDVRHPSYITVHETQARIRLRLNPKERQTEAVLKAMGTVAVVAKNSAASTAQVNAEVQQLINSTQVVLKNEWRRVKTGEFVYRWTRRILPVFLVLFAALFLYRQHLTSSAYLITAKRFEGGVYRLTMKHRGNTVTAQCSTNCEYVVVGDRYWFTRQSSGLSLDNPKVVIGIEEERMGD